jgi:hypothetical protein
MVTTKVAINRSRSLGKTASLRAKDRAKAFFGFVNRAYL